MRQTRLNRSHKHEDTPATPSGASRDTSSHGDMMSLQSTMGNAAVGSLVRSREQAMAESATPVDAFTQNLIAGQAGRGYAIQDGVRVHHDADSDALTRRLGATGFTQGSDVFLRSDRHPASEAGRATLAHELTHVAQGSVGPGAVMREPEPDQTETVDAGEKSSSSLVLAKITLKSGGDVDGGSTVAGHKGEVEFSSLGFSNSGRVGGAGGGTEGGQSKTTTDLTGTKRVDNATPALFEAVAKGDPVVSARFVFVKVVDKGTVEEKLTLDFKDGFVTQDSPSGDYESVSFSFNKG